MRVEITATDRYIRVLRADGSQLSRHTIIEEAIQAAINAGDGSYRLIYPDRTVKVIGVLAPQFGDTQAPTIPGQPQLVVKSATTISVTAAGSTDNIGVTGYQWYLNGTPITTTVNPSHTFTGLAPNTVYAITVSAFDAAGNSSAQSQTQNITTNTNAAPAWSVGQQDLTVGTGYSLDLLSVCSDADTNPLTFSIVSGTLPTGLVFSASLKTVSGTPSAVQTQAVTFRANDGIVNSDQVITFVSLNADTTAPPVPTMSAMSSITASSMLAAWGAVSDTVVANARTSGGVQYILQRATNSGFTTGVVTEALQAGVSKSVTGLSAGTQYWFRVRSQDAAGNQSAFSASVNATTDSSAVLFFDNSFEDDFASWTGSTGTTAIATSGVASDGVKYMQSVLANGSFNDNGRYKEIGTAGNIVNQFRNGFVQADYSFGAFTGLWPASDQQKMMIVQYYDPVWASFSNSRRKFQVILGVAADSLSQRGQYYFQLIEWNDTTGTFVQGANVFQNLGTAGPAASFDKWDRIRFQIQLDTNGGATLGAGQGNGILRLWVNNTLVMEHLDVNMVRGNANVGCGRLLPNSTAQGSTWQGTASTLNWDNVQMATTASLLDAMWSTPPNRIVVAGTHNPDTLDESSTVLYTRDFDTQVAGDIWNQETPGVTMSYSATAGYNGTGAWRAKSDPISASSLNEIRAGWMGSDWGGAASFLPFNTHEYITVSFLIKMTSDFLDLIHEGPGSYWNHDMKSMDFRYWTSGGSFEGGRNRPIILGRQDDEFPYIGIGQSGGGASVSSGEDARAYGDRWVWLCSVIDMRGATSADRFVANYIKVEGVDTSVRRLQRMFESEGLSAYDGFGLSGWNSPLFGFWANQQDAASFDAGQTTKLANAYLTIDRLRVIAGYPTAALGPPF